jgi:hypothetical protein
MTTTTKKAHAVHARLSKLLSGPVRFAPAETATRGSNSVTAIHARLGRLLQGPAR